MPAIRTFLDQTVPGSAVVWIVVYTATVKMAGVSACMAGLGPNVTSANVIHDALNMESVPMDPVSVKTAGWANTVLWTAVPTCAPSTVDASPRSVPSRATT